ncbi:MAG: DUF1599 domain-containing protein [Chitinophagales bacterium]|nr:DUF1599 domain-containing protein [Chitinophagales bacterium]
MESETSRQFDAAIEQCRNVFEKKSNDYGTSWRVLRLASLADQIFIKAQRIRTIDHLAEKKIDEEMDSEFIGIVNYSVIALIRLQIGAQIEEEINHSQLIKWYDEKIAEAKKLMLAKNHDYGEAWRNMLLSSFTDLIMMRVLRIRKISQNEGVTLASEGIDANLFDIINYAIFALIKIREHASQ